MNRIEPHSLQAATAAVRGALRRHCTRRHVAIALSAALPYLAATAMLLLR